MGDDVATCSECGKKRGAVSGPCECGSNEVTPRNPLAEKAAYVERLSAWLVDADRIGELSAAARASTGLDGVYEGRSQRLRLLVRLAYLRGVRRGVAIAWDAKQPIGLRDGSGAPREEGAC